MKHAGLPKGASAANRKEGGVRRQPRDVGSPAGSGACCWHCWDRDNPKTFGLWGNLTA